MKLEKSNIEPSPLPEKEVEELFTWIIYYGDGSIFTNKDYYHEDVPADNVQVIACDDGTWLGGDEEGMHDYLRGNTRNKKVIFGRHISNWRFTPIRIEAQNTKKVSPDRVILMGYDYYWWVNDLPPDGGKV